MKKIFALIFALTLSTFLCVSCAKNYEATVDISNNTTKMVAHRGLSGLEVENTVNAFRLAGNHSYYGVEADVRKTSDGKFVMCHDDSLKRISGFDLKVENSTLNSLKNVVLYDKNSKSKTQNIKIATLEEYIEVCKECQKHCYLELKPAFSLDDISNIISIINNYNYLESVTFISFDYQNLLHVRSLLPTQPVQFLFNEVTNEIKEKLARDKIDVDVKHKGIKKADVEYFHSIGLKVNCWTVDSKATAEKLISWGVDYITTNILE
ncbi:MAG: hypothetical protein IKL82_05870 [Clostridia bacterium]|nr:hypothetical protein [Clostridia bacterium]